MLKVFRGNLFLLFLPLIVFSFGMINLCVLNQRTMKNTVIKASEVYSGYKWLEIDSLDIPSVEKTRIKSAILRLLIDSSRIAGAESWKTETSIIDYVYEVDKFYQEPNNRKVPVFFAFRIACLKKQNYPDSLINLYKKHTLDRIDYFLKK